MRALIIGSSSGVGLATAKLMHQKGYEVWATTSKSNAQIQDFFQYFVDLTSPQSRDEFWKKIEKTPPDLLICNAGIGEIGSVERFEFDKLREMWEINYFAHVDFVQKCLLYFRQKKQGHIIFLGSVTTRISFPFKAQYSATKSALTSFAECLQAEVSPYNIKVQILEPGWIRSEFHNNLKPRQDFEVYSKRFKAFLNHKNDLNPKYPDGLAVAKVILTCVNHQDNRLRIPVGPDSKMLHRWRWILEIPLFQNLKNRILNHYLVKQEKSYSNKE